MPEAPSRDTGTLDPCDPGGVTLPRGTHCSLAKNGLETKMVYGEPYESDGVTVIMASTVGTIAVAA